MPASVDVIQPRTSGPVPKASIPLGRSSDSCLTSQFYPAMDSLYSGLTKKPVILLNPPCRRNLHAGIAHDANQSPERREQRRAMHANEDRTAPTCAAELTEWRWRYATAQRGLRIPSSTASAGCPCRSVRHLDAIRRFLSDLRSLLGRPETMDTPRCPPDVCVSGGHRHLGRWNPGGVQSRPASRILSASRRGLVNMISWLPGIWTSRKYPRRLDIRGCHPHSPCRRPLSSVQLM